MPFISTQFSIYIDMVLSLDERIPMEDTLIILKSLRKCRKLYFLFKFFTPLILMCHCFIDFVTIVYLIPTLFMKALNRLKNTLGMNHQLLKKLLFRFTMIVQYLT